MRDTQLYELADGKQATYQTLDLSDPLHPEVKVETRRKRRLFWWLRGGFGKPRKQREGLDSLHRKFEFRQDVFKHLSVLFYPQGPGSCDHTKVDRSLNLLTTLPFFAVAWHTYRERKTWEGKLWGASLAGVGLGSAAFHSTSGEMRPLTRKLDYFSIALSSIAMMRSVFPHSSRNRTAFALAATPINPLAVSTVNAIAMEGQYLRRAKANPHLRSDHQLHLATCALGAVCFAIEDYYPHYPIIHAVWHCLSGLSVATTNYLMADIEAEKGLRGPTSIQPPSPPPQRAEQL